MAEGTITRKDIITDEALKWGDEYAKNLNQAIAINKEFVDSIILLNAENVKLRRSENQTEFIKQKNEVRLIAEKSILLLKEEQVAETNLEKVKQEALKTEKLALDIAKKKQDATKTTIKLSVEERLANEQNNRLAKEQAILASKMTTAYTKLNLERTIAKRTLLDLLSAENKNVEAIKKAEIEFAKLDVRVRKADQAVGDFHKSVGNYPKIANLTSGLKNLAGAFGLLGGVALFASIMKNAFDTIKQFGQALADLEAITGATGKDLDYLKNQAIELGKETKGGAVAVVEAYKLIASAKPELLENVQALNQVTEAVLTLAQASGMEMPDAAIALTDAMNQFGADASQATVFIDALANGAKYGAAEIPQVTEALLKFGAVARTSNVSIQESTALIELLAENGLKGADAGTALRNVLLKISAPDALPRRAQEEFAKLGISLETLKDKSIPIQEKLELLKPLLKDNASIVKIFGLENATAALNVLGHTDRLKELTGKMNENGTATEQANIRMDTLNGSIVLLESAWSSFILGLSEKGNAGGEFLKFWVNDAIDTLSLLDDWFTTSEQKRERELAKIRKEGADSAIKHYADKNKRSLDDLNNVIAYNNAEIAENTRAALELEKANKKIAADDSFFNSGKRKKQIEENKRKIQDLNSKTVFADAENKTVKGFIQQRTAKPADANGGSTGVDSKTQDALDKKALDGAKKRSDSLYELEKQRLERTIKINSDIASDDKMNDDVRIKALETVQQKQIALIELTKQHSLDADKFVTAENKLNANQKELINKEAAYKEIDINKKTAEEIKKINEFDSKEYELELKRGSDVLAIANENAIAEEEKRFQAELALGYENDKAKEDAAKEHERKLFEIKKSGLIAQTRLQINNLNDELNAYEAQSDGSQKSQDFILAKRAKVAELTARLIQAEGGVFNENEEGKEEAVKISTEEILQISSEAVGQLADLSNAFSERKIQKIDEEIEKNNEYYGKQIELAGSDIKQKELLEKERDKKNEVLEKKKQAAQRKQAIFDKAVTVAQIALNTALSIMKAAATTAPTFWAVAIASALGAISMATALATPIPKYKQGRKGGPAETAWVGDGGVSEVITSSKGMNPRLTPNIPTLTHLNEGDIVHKSMADYQAYMRASILSGLKMDGHRMNEFQAMQNNDLYGKESLSVMKETLSVLKKQKNGSTINMPKLDINHHLWKMRNTNWN